MNTKAEQTRQLIVEKTAPIFNVKGYAGTSVSDMTKATGLTKGSVYGNFANKAERFWSCRAAGYRGRWDLTAAVATAMGEAT